MAPEQALGQPIDARSDVFSFGVVLYELLAGRRAFAGDSDWAVTTAVVRDGPKPLSEIRPDLPDALRQIVDSLSRKGSAATLSVCGGSARRSAAADAGGAPSRAGVDGADTWRRPPSSLLAVVLAGAWVAVRRWQTATMVERSIPEVERLAAAGQYVEAYRLAQRATQAAPADPRVRRDAPRRDDALRPWPNRPAPTCISRTTATSTEPGTLLGRIPIKDARVPHRPAALEDRQRRVRSRRGVVANRAVASPFIVRERHPRAWCTCAAEHLRRGSTRVQLPDFWIDKYEVTNREFKRFADAGGYSNRQYWKEPFVIDGVNRSFDDAVARFTDKTGRPGPATWELGTFREGQADYPVAGVSWYEASAYAEFAGKRLPTVFHWKQATGNACSVRWSHQSRISTASRP